MPDIALRFDKDMLVLSAPIDAVLSRQGVDVEQDKELFSLIEPEAVRDAYRLEQLAGAQCLVTNTEAITKARLSHRNMEDRATDIARSSLRILNDLKPQHILVEIGPTALPLDPSSAASLKQNRDQYAQAALAFGQDGFDAFFLNGMTNSLDLQCALMGIRKESDVPIFASMRIAPAELDAGDLIEPYTMMAEYGADVVGLATTAGLDQVIPCVEELVKQVERPLLVQLIVKKNDPKQQQVTKENPYYCPDTMIEAAARLRGAGVQFLRAEGDATPAYTGSLVVASEGFDVL